MSLSRFTLKHRLRDYALRKFVSKAIGVWHRGYAWILGPLLVGLTGVFMATASDYANDFNHRLFSTFRFVPLLVLPGGFAGLAHIARRYSPGTRGSGIQQAGVTRAPITVFTIMMEMTDSNRMLLPLMSATGIANAVSKLICPTALYQALATGFEKPPAAVPSASSEVGPPALKHK